jgi:glycosyltransferase involved in cell wall biosynthesis
MKSAPAVDLSLAIPFYNEEECAVRATQDLVAALEERGVSYELILVDNGSTDRTFELLRSMQGHNPRLRVLHFDTNRGFGGAIRAGLAEGRGRYVGFTCGDGEISCGDTVALYETVRNRGWSLGKGLRVDRPMTVMRRWFSWGYNRLIRFLFRVPASDVNGYPVVMKREMLAGMRLTRDDWTVNVEILDAARRAGGWIGEVEVRCEPRKGGKSHVTLLFPAIFFLQVLRLRLRL